MIIISGCYKRMDVTGVAEEERIKRWRTLMLTQNELHTTPYTIDSSYLDFHVLADNSLRFDLYIDSFQYVGDPITSVKMHFGEPTINGPVMYDFPARFSPGGVTGIIYNLRSGFRDSLLDDNILKYVNITTQRAPQGLVRGQLTPALLYSANVDLSGTNMNPPATTSTTAKAYIRIGENNKLYSKIEISNPDPTNAPATAEIRSGAVGTNGPVVKVLVSDASQFGTSQVITLTDTERINLLSGSTYITVSTASNPNGLLRGQLK